MSYTGELASPALAAAVLFLIWYLFFRKSPNAILTKIPGPPIYPVIGSLLSVPASQTEVISKLRQWCEQSPGGIVYSCFPLANIHVVTLFSPEAAEPVLASRKQLDKGADYDLMRPWLGDGLLTSTGSKWHSRRKLITPAFHFGILDQFLEVMNEQSAVLAGRLAAAGPGPVDIWRFVSEMTLDVIAEAAMGVGVGAQAGTSSEYKQAIQTMGDIVHQRSLKPWLKTDAIFRLLGWKRKQDDALAVLHAFTKSVIDKKRLMLKQKQMSPDDDQVSKKKKRLAFLDILLESEDGDEPLSDADIAEETDTFMFEGHDTTASGICWTLFNVARLPAVQQKIHEELDAVLSDVTGDPSREDLGKLKYLECAIKESLRLFPPVVFYSRTLDEDMTILGYTVPKGTDVLLYAPMLHRDPRHWNNPEVFDPDRFLPENSGTRHPYSYVPFSAGPRNCIGQRFALLEMKAVLVALLRRFRISTSEVYSEKILRICLTLQKDGPFAIKFEPRSSVSI